MLRTIWSSTATGCCCPVETISGGWSTCAAQAGEDPAAKARPMSATSLPPSRRSRPRTVENSALCKMIQLDHLQTLPDRVSLTTSSTVWGLFVLFHSSKVTAPTPSPSPDPDVDEADMEEEDDEVVEEEEEEEEEVDEEEVEEEEEEEEVVAVKDPEEYEYPIDSGPYQTPEYLDSYDYEKSHKPTTSTPLMKGDGCKGSLSILFLHTHKWLTCSEQSLPAKKGKVALGYTKCELRCLVTWLACNGWIALFFFCCCCFSSHSSTVTHHSHLRNTSDLHNTI